MLLTTPDATALRAVPEGKALRRLARWLVLLGGVTLFLVTAATTGEQICSVAAPCEPLPATSLLIGLMAVTPFLGWVHVGFAATVAPMTAVALIWHDAATPSMAAPGWVHLGAVGYAAMCVLLAWKVSARRPLIGEWAARQEQAVTPAPSRLARPGRVACAFGAILLGLAVVCIGWSLWTQHRMDQRQSAAQVVIVRVVENIDEFTVQVAMPDGQIVNLDVLDVKPYVVGAAHPMAVDSAGLRQLVAEPYDATPWLALAMLLTLTGAGLLVRGRAKRVGYQRLFREPQPVTAVHARWHDSAVQAFAGDAAEHDLPLFTVEVRDWTLVPQVFPAPQMVTIPHQSYPDDDLEGNLEDEDDGFEGEDDELQWTVPAQPQLVCAATPAVLHAVPAPGQWCALTVHGVTFDPAKPIRWSNDPVPLRPGEPGVERPLAAAEVATLQVGDYAPDPRRLYVSRVAPLPAYALTLAMPLAGAKFYQRLPAAMAPASVHAVIGGCVAVLMLLGWFTLIRPRVAWNGGGVAVRAMFGRGTRVLPWSQVNGIRLDGDIVTIGTAGDAFSVSAPRFGGASATELWIKLRNARLRADPAAAPPDSLAAGHLEGALVFALWAGMTVGLSALTLWATVWAQS